MQDQSLQLRVTLEQAAETGLTQYHTIRKAFLEFPNFKWDRVAGVLPEDFAKFHAALNAAGANRYNGFHRDLGVAAATNFASLAWVAKELFIRRGGVEASALKHFRGWIGAPLHKTAQETLLTDYRDEINPDAVADPQAAAGLIAAFRANAIPLAGGNAAPVRPPPPPNGPPADLPGVEPWRARGRWQKRQSSSRRARLRPS